MTYSHVRTDTSKMLYIKGMKYCKRNPQDFAKALEYLTKAASKGSADAQLELGNDLYSC